MSDTIFELATQLTVLAAGRRPSWLRQYVSPALASAYVDVAPQDAAWGKSVVGSLKTLVAISPREVAAYRTAIVQIDTYDGGGTYTTTVAGHAVPTAANTDKATTLQDIAADINADTGTGAGDYVTATVETVTFSESPLVQDTVVVLRGKAEADWSFVVAASGGAAAATGIADPATVSARIWGLPRDDAGNNGPGWDEVNNGDLGVIDYRGYSERYDTPGYDRLFVEPYAVSAVSGDGASTKYRFKVRYGPCVLE